MFHKHNFDHLRSAEQQTDVGDVTTLVRCVIPTVVLCFWKTWEFNRMIHIENCSQKAAAFCTRPKPLAKNAACKEDHFILCMRQIPCWTFHEMQKGNSPLSFGQQSSRQNGSCHQTDLEMKMKFQTPTFIFSLISIRGKIHLNTHYVMIRIKHTSFSQNTDTLKGVIYKQMVYSATSRLRSLGAQTRRNPHLIIFCLQIEIINWFVQPTEQIFAAQSFHADKLNEVNSAGKWRISSWKCPFCFVNLRCTFAAWPHTNTADWFRKVSLGWNKSTRRRCRRGEQCNLLGPWNGPASGLSLWRVPYSSSRLLRLKLNTMRMSMPVDPFAHAFVTLSLGALRCRASNAWERLFCWTQLCYTMADFDRVAHSSMEHRKKQT